MNKIRKNDKILVISGQDRGRIGKILRVVPKADKVVVEEMNIITKHIKPKKQGEKGQRIQTPAPMHWSNVKLICPKCNKATRIGFGINKGRKFRVCKKCGQEV